MITYIVNGNASPHIMLEGIEGADPEEAFIILTTDKCPEAHLDYIKGLCGSDIPVQHRKIKSQKKWFANNVKSIFRNYLNGPNDHVVIMPTLTISGTEIDKYIASGKVSIVPDYASYEKNALIDTSMSNWNQIVVSGIKAGGRMHILIDYENVHNAGLEGADYLTKDDYVTVFYSQSCENIQLGHFNALVEKTGHFDAVKLAQVRKNGLDFYIAIRVGEILQKYPGEKILIVSQDQGYYAILDYCTAYGGIAGEIKFAASIEAGIVMLDGETDRRKRIMNIRKNTSLDTQFAIYQEKKSLYQQIAQLLADTPYADEVDRIFQIIETKDTPKKLYTATLHEFGTKRGLEIYRLIKKSA